MAQKINQDLVEKIEAVVTYTPLSDEVVPKEYFHTDATHVYQVPQDRDVDPVLLAEELTTRFVGKSVVVLIPGRVFDATGTRHGRGGGWYDRFLSAAPKEWIRIGFCYDEQLSKESLMREPWDEPVDAVYAVDSASKEMTIYWTHARFPD